MVMAILSIAVGLYVASAAILFFWQRSIQYSPSHRDSEGKGNKVFTPWKDRSGKFLGYYRRASQPRRVVIFFHGSRGEALDRSWADELVPQQDLLVLAEYPGYGARKGKISEKSLLADAEALVDEARASWGGCPVVAVGESLGGAVAAYLASRGKIDRLALISPFLSLAELAARRYRFFPVQWLLQDKFRTLEFVKGAQVPVHMVHGTLDEAVPLEHGRALFQAYPAQEKEFHEVPGFGHSNLADAILHSPFTLRFRQFLAS